MTFEAILRENGFRKPLMPFLWAKAHDAFCQKAASYNRAAFEWRNRKKNLEAIWGKDIPDYHLIVPFHVYFRNPTEAEKAFRNFQVTDPSTLEKKFEVSLRKEWIASIISAAGKDCKLIAIKNTGYNTQTAKAYFEKQVEAREEAFVVMSGNRKNANITYYY